jgi:hypothetical protein
VEERISRERIAQRKSDDKVEDDRDPEEAARKFRIMLLLVFIAFLIAVNFLYDYVAASQGKRDKPRVLAYGGKSHNNDF